MPNRYSGLDPADHGLHLIVASEPSTYKAEDWHLIGKNQCVVASPGKGFEVRDIKYREEWDAVDPNA